MLSPLACRTVIELALGQYRDYWRENDIDWCYHITEESDDYNGNERHTVKIGFSMRDNAPTPMHTQSYAHESANIARKMSWNRLLEAICLSGVANSYRSTVELHRIGAFRLDGTQQWVKSYPLTAKDLSLDDATPD